MEEIKRLLLEEKDALLSEIREKTGNKNEINNDIGDAIDSSLMTSATVTNAEKLFPRNGCWPFLWLECASIASQMKNAVDLRKMLFPVQTTPVKY